MRNQLSNLSIYADDLHEMEREFIARQVTVHVLMVNLSTRTFNSDQLSLVACVIHIAHSLCIQQSTL